MTFGIIIFILLLLFAPIPIKISFSYINDIARLKIYFKEIVLNKPVKDKKTKKKKPKKKTFDYKRFLSKDKILLFHKKFKKVFVIDSLYIFTEFGLGDPYNTALLFGALNSFSFAIYEVINYFVHINNFSIKLIPNTSKKILNNETNSIFFISFAKIIYILLLFIYIFYIKSKLSRNKEELKWKTTQ